MKPKKVFCRPYRNCLGWKNRLIKINLCRRQCNFYVVSLYAIQQVYTQAYHPNLRHNFGQNNTGRYGFLRKMTAVKERIRREGVTTYNPIFRDGLQAVDKQERFAIRKFCEDIVEILQGYLLLKMFPAINRNNGPVNPGSFVFTQQINHIGHIVGSR